MQPTLGEQNTTIVTYLFADPTLGFNTQVRVAHDHAPQFDQSGDALVGVAGTIPAQVQARTVLPTASGRADVGNHHGLQHPRLVPFRELAFVMTVGVLIDASWPGRCSSRAGRPDQRMAGKRLAGDPDHPVHNVLATLLSARGEFRYITGPRRQAESHRYPGALVTHTTNAARSAALRRPLAVLVAAAGFAVAGCATDAAPSPAPSLPVETSTQPAEPQTATVDWARSMCQALDPAFEQLGAPPQPDLGNLDATRLAYIDYLGNARNAAQQAIDRLAAVGAPPVENGQQVLESMRIQLIQLREDLDEALAQLNRADPNDVGRAGLALGAAGNVLAALGNRAQVLANLAVDPQLRAAINQTPECQNVIGDATIGTTQPTGSPQPTG